MMHSYRKERDVPEIGILEFVISIYDEPILKRLKGSEHNKRMICPFRFSVERNVFYYNYKLDYGAVDGLEQFKGRILGVIDFPKDVFAGLTGNPSDLKTEKFNDCEKVIYQVLEEVVEKETEKDKK